MNEPSAFEIFRQMAPVDPGELVGLWKGRGVPTGHPLDGVLENLGWFGKRFTQDLRADALLFQSGERRLTAIDPAPIPVNLALRFHHLGRTRAARNLFSYLQRGLRAHGPTARLKVLSYDGVQSAAMVYDRMPITDHFRQKDKDTLMGLMVIEKDARRYLFELERVKDAAEAERCQDLKR
ncbi:GXWXG domain-containing protein [Rhizobium rhizophilum]|nr:GXWXG domain-containing protein [Rhizobium rhizophilum]